LGFKFCCYYKLSFSYDESVVSEDSVSVVGSSRNADQSLIKGFVHSVQQIVETTKESNDAGNNLHGENSPRWGNERNKGRDFHSIIICISNLSHHPHNGGGRRPPWQKRGDLYKQPRGWGQFKSSNPPNRNQKSNSKPDLVLAKSSDPHFSNLVQEIKTNENI